MQKIILIMCILFTGCSALNIRKDVIIINNEKKTTNVDEITRQNLSSVDFSLPKVEITIEEEGEKQKLMGNVRYINPGILIVSLRNNAGIEGVRIYIDKDTVLANDRIYKKLYYGSAAHLSEKYGISADYLPVVVGDLIIDSKQALNEMKCEKGSTEIIGYTGKKKIRYIVDCRFDKIVNALVSPDDNRAQIEINFSSFRKLDNMLYPGIIQVKDTFNKTNIYIEIKKAEIYNGPELKFIPGGNYELILLQ